jgi:hypothetical protein
MNRISAILRTAILPAILFLAPAPPASAVLAQDAPPAAAGAPAHGHGPSEAPEAGNPFLAEQREAMARLAGWAGEWQGSGWAMARDGRGRIETSIHESVRSKLGGLALVVEGLGRTRDAESGEEKVTHDALGVITWDPHGDRYLFRYWSAEGQAGETELVPVEGGWRWGFTAPGGGPEVRFTIELGADTWRERGEVSMDGGESWFPMLEMTLTRRDG